MDLQVDLHNDLEIDLTIYSRMTRQVVGKLSLMERGSLKPLEINRAENERPLLSNEGFSEMGEQDPFSRATSKQMRLTPRYR